MQAQLELRRFPAASVAFVLALAAVLLLGVSLGYVLKPSTIVSGPTHTVVVPGGELVSSNATDDLCVLINHHKEC